MIKTPAVRLLLAGFMLLIGGVTQAYAQGSKYAPADMLDASWAPKHDDVTITTPTVDELKLYTVVTLQGSVKGSGGYMLLDAKKLPVRRFFNSKGTGMDMWSYYKDGVEVYREFDTAGKGTPNNFRWLNAGGMKWGVGGVSQGKAYITAWRMISAEETAFEAFQAVAKGDYARMQALQINENEMQMVKLSASKIKAIGTIQQNSQRKFADFVQEVKLGAVKFDGVETGVPQCDTTSDDIVIKHASRAIRYETTNAKNEKQHAWIHTGEMIQVGMAWRVVDVPMSKDPTGAEPANPNLVKVAPADPKLEKAQNDLADLDKDSPPPAGIRDNNAKVNTYYQKRIALVNQILQLAPADQREGWYKQLFDNMTAMAQNSGDKAVVGMLNKFKDDVVATKELGANLAAYGTYRCLWTDYALAMGATPPPPQNEIVKLQEKWLSDLAAFVGKYSKAEDTPEALNQLALGCEFNGKTEESKRWYQQLVADFADHHQAPRAKGSLVRLNLVRNKMTLTAPLLADSTKQFDLSDLKGKVVIVHYWGSYSDQYLDDFAKLKRIMDDVGAKQKVELVCINLDEDAARAKAAVAKAQAPGIHLFHANNNAVGLSSPLATQYGIHSLPTLFMVGRDGLVTSNSLQIGDIATELKNAQ
ncbi:MAG: hypothetical protein EXR98_11825 [Gemmataceae bacterium]|nr:hypothetical protein [Gemmataceae bacterium]